MKKIFFLALVFTLFASILAVRVMAENSTVGLKPTPLPSTDLGKDVLRRAQELQKRELRVNNTSSNSAEALQSFKQKTLEAKKQRVACLQSRAADIKELEAQARASGSAKISSCSAKALLGTVVKPSRPLINGLSEIEKKMMSATFSAQMRAYTRDLQSAMKTCRLNMEQGRLALKEKILSIKEECSNAERSVLGLSTEIPYNAQ